MEAAAEGIGEVGEESKRQTPFSSVPVEIISAALGVFVRGLMKKGPFCNRIA